MTKKKYPSDLTDEEWGIVKQKLIEIYPYKGGHQLKVDNYREIISAIYYINKTGIQWEYLPNDYPPPTTVNDHYLKLSREGFF